ASEVVKCAWLEATGGQKADHRTLRDRRTCTPLAGRQAPGGLSLTDNSSVATLATPVTGGAPCAGLRRAGSRATTPGPPRRSARSRSSTASCGASATPDLREHAPHRRRRNSAGGQFVVRYAATNRVDGRLPAG